RRELCPHRRVQRRDLPTREQQERDHADDLLRVVGTVGEREAARHHPLAIPHRAARAGGRATCEPPPDPVGDGAAHEPEPGRECERHCHSDDQSGAHRAILSGMSWMRTPFVALLVTSMVALVVTGASAVAQSEPSPAVVEQPGLVFATVDGEPILLDAYLPVT